MRWLTNATRYLDSWHQSEISNEYDAQFSGHVLHDRPALITKAWKNNARHFQSTLLFVNVCKKYAPKANRITKPLFIFVMQKNNHLVTSKFKQTNRLNKRSVLTLSNAQFDLEVHRGGHHRLGENQDVFKANNHHQVRKDLTAEKAEKQIQSHPFFNICFLNYVKLLFVALEAAMTLKTFIIFSVGVNPPYLCK